MDIIVIQELIFHTQQEKLQLAENKRPNVYEGLVAVPEIPAYSSKWHPRTMPGYCQ